MNSGKVAPEAMPWVKVTEHSHLPCLEIYYQNLFDGQLVSGSWYSEARISTVGGASKSNAGLPLLEHSSCTTGHSQWQAGRLWLTSFYVKTSIIFASETTHALLIAQRNHEF